MAYQLKGKAVIGKVDNSPYWVLLKKLYIYVLEKGSSFLEQ